MDFVETQRLVQEVATVIGVAGGVLGLIKFFSDRREKEIREWQKVVIYKMFRQSELSTLDFKTVLLVYRSEGQAFPKYNLRKKDISEDELRRVLLELVSSGILSMEASDSFRLKVTVPKVDQIEIVNVLNDELVKLVAPNPYVYTLDEVLKEIAPKVGIAIPLLRNDFNLTIQRGILLQDKDGKIAFPQ